MEGSWMSRAVQHMCVCVLETHNGDDFTRTDFIGVTVLNETNEGWKSGIDDGNEQCNIIRFTLVMLAKHKKGDESPQFKIKCSGSWAFLEASCVDFNILCNFMKICIVFECYLSFVLHHFRAIFDTFVRQMRSACYLFDFVFFWFFPYRLHVV